MYVGLKRGYIAFNEDTESRIVGRVADKTAEKLVVESEGTLTTRKKKTRERGEGDREKWRPRAEITFVFLI